jgi:hypothetical protein
MMNRPSVISRIVVLPSDFRAGFLTAASAIVNIDNFTVTLNGSPLFDDSSGAGLTLAVGDPLGAILPSGTNFSTGTPANHQVHSIGDWSQKDTRHSTRGPHIPAAVFSAINRNTVDVLTGPPAAGDGSNPVPLTPNDGFATIGQLDLTMPQAVGELYYVELSDRVASNTGMGDVPSVDVRNCLPGVVSCGSVTGRSVTLTDANFAANTRTIIGQAPLITSNQQILLELAHPTAEADDVFGSFAYR